jgi:hypothetical protein
LLSGPGQEMEGVSQPPEPATRSGRKAIDLAWDALESKDTIMLASNSGSRLAKDHLLLPFFESRLTVDFGRRTILFAGCQADEATAILALHYLAGCGPGVPRGVLVPFNQAEGGAAYYEAFKRRTIDRLAEEFGEDPGSLIRAGGVLGGMDRELGAASIDIRAFPKVRLTLIVWEGDEEIPASANVLFDSVALEILDTEDLAVVGSLTMARLLKAKAQL